MSQEPIYTDYELFHPTHSSFVTNSLRTVKAVSRGCPQGSCCGTGFWNLQFNSLLELKFMARTKFVAYADDFLIATKGAVENYANL